MGAFSLGYPPNKRNWALCCSPHGNMGLYYAWDATLRYSNGVARVNLLLNRASPWMDIDSYIPYQGKVVLRNKQAKEAFVRMPLYVDLETVTCTVGKDKVRPTWLGRYLRIGNLEPKDVVTIRFPVQDRIETWKAPPRANYISWLPESNVYTVRFRGNTVIDMDPPLIAGTWHYNTGPEYAETSLYRDRPEKYKTSAAPMKNVRRYITPERMKW